MTAIAPQDLAEVQTFAKARREAGRTWWQIARDVRAQFGISLQQPKIKRLVDGYQLANPESLGVSLLSDKEFHARLDGEKARLIKEGDETAQRMGWQCQYGCLPRNYMPTCKTCGRLR